MKINLFQIIFQIINFTVLLFLLRKYLYRPVLKILEQRAKKIHDGLEAAEKSIEEREKVEKEKKKILVEAEKNASQILEGARMRAKKLEKQMLEKAEKELESKQKRAERYVNTRLQDLEEDLKKRFTTSVVETSESLLKDTLGPKEQRVIIKRQIQRLKNVKFS